MKHAKKLISMLLALIMVASIIPATAAANSGIVFDGLVDYKFIDQSSFKYVKWGAVTGANYYRITVVYNNDTNTVLTPSRNYPVYDTQYNISSIIKSVDIPSTLKIYVDAVNGAGNVISGKAVLLTVIETPVITCGSAGSVTTSSAKLSVTINKNYGSAIKAAGFYVGTSSNVSAAKQYSISSVSNSGTMTKTISGLQAGTTYYYWAYAENSVGETISSRKSFTTEEATPTTEGITSISEGKAILDFPPSSSSVGTVQKGRIRYVGQILADPKFSSSYWKNSRYDFVSDKSCQGMCTRAVFSMALSYLGIDLTPVKMSELTGLADIDAPYDSVLKAMTGYPSVARVKTTVSQAYSNYLNNPNYSPAYLHFDYGSSLHCLLIVGKKSANTYIVVDPSVRSNSASGMSNEHVYEITINETSKTITSVAYNGKAAWTSWNGAEYSGANQWYLTGTTPTSYTITYDYGYGIDGFTAGTDAKVDKVTKQHGQNHVILDTQYTKTGYKFLGWGVYPNVTTVKYKAGAVYSTNANLYLYAVWEKTACSHSWSGWSSTGSTQHKRTCSLCAEVQTASHAWHSWMEYSTTQHKRTCSACGASTYGDHDWDGGVVTKQPTTTSTGVRTYTCYDCDGTKTETIPKLEPEECDHSWSNWSNYSATQHKRDCQFCGEYTYGYHDWNSGVTSGDIVTYTCYICDGTKNETVTTPEPPVDIGDRPVIKVSSVSGRAGQTVDVTIAVQNNSGIAGMMLKLAYPEQFELVDISEGTALPGLEFTPPGNYAANPISLSWDGLDADEGNGIVLTLSFRITEGTPDGEYSLSLSYNDGDVYDGNMEDVSPELIQGVVTVKEAMPGDANGDNIINGKDVTLIRRYLAGGYSIAGFNQQNADVNEDGNINGKDVTTVRRYLAGGYGIVLEK